jgi:hypothetical protein
MQSSNKLREIPERLDLAIPIVLMKLADYKRRSDRKRLK